MLFSLGELTPVWFGQPVPQSPGACHCKVTLLPVTVLPLAGETKTALVGLVAVHGGGGVGVGEGVGEPPPSPHGGLGQPQHDLVVICDGSLHLVLLSRHKQLVNFPVQLQYPALVLHVTFNCN